MMEQLLARLRAAPAIEGSYHICAVLGRGYLAKTPGGKGALLVPCQRGTAALGRTFGAMLLKFKSEVAFDVDGTRWSGPAALVECLEDELLPTFLALAGDVMATIGDAGDVTADAVIRALGHWEMLLRNRALLSEEAQLGLWGELAFVLAAPSIDAALRAWSPGARDPLDFVANGVGVEVKSSVVRLKHSISQNQAASDGGDLELFFASIWVVPDPTGRNLREMVEAVSSSCSEHALLEQKLLVTGYSRAHADAYGRKFALGAQVVIFPASAVPRVRSWDVGVASIRFSVELDQEAALDEATRARVLSALCVVRGS
jgi:hypothetical protein